MNQQNLDPKVEQDSFDLLREMFGFFYFRRDLEGNFTYVDPGIEAIVGYSPSEFLLQWNNLLSRSKDKGLKLGGLGGKPGDRAKQYEVELLHQNGNSCWLDVMERPVFENDGILSASEGVACNITQRKSMELSMRFTLGRFREISDSSPVGIFQVDPDDRFVYVNLRFQTIVGRVLHGILGNPWWEVIHPEDVGKVFQAWPEAEQENREFRMECRVVRPDGGVRWVEIRSRFFFHDEGKITFGIMEDISERKKTEEQLERFADELQRSNKDLEDFASIASHDLQEPLRKVMMFGERLFSSYRDVLGDTGMDYLERMRNATERMQTFINDLLKYSRVSTKIQPFVSADLNKIAVEVLSDLEARVNRSEGRVEIGELPTLVADVFQMRQLFQNLIGNGLKFHRPDVPPVVGVHSRRMEGGSWEITVEDNGIGFDEKYLDRIFKPFERLQGRSKYEGSGMGLAICDKIVKRHRGTITARSVLNEGTRFIITLPESQSAQS